jgi:LacI family transcriptional regulator
MKKPTAKDVAQMAGVSQTTVSMILNNKENVSFADETVEKVLQAAKRLNYYTPVFLKTSQRPNKRLIALLTATITNPYYPMLTQAIEETAIPRGYTTLVCNIHRNADIEKYYLELMTDNLADGIIYTFSPTFPDMLKIISETIPVVIIGEKDDRLDIDTVCLDSYKSGMLVAEHLLQLGHEKIAFVTSPVNNTMSLTRRQRLQGVIDKFKEMGQPEENLLIKSADKEAEMPNSIYEIESGYHLTVELLSEASVSAIIGSNDMIACGIMTALTDKGYKIPQQISVCGFDNIFIASIVNPRLTTIDHCMQHRAKTAVDILIERIEHRGDGKVATPLNRASVYQIEYTPQLIERNSTGPYKKT